MHVSLKLKQVGTAIGSDFRDDFNGFGMERSTDHWHAGFDDASFLSGNLCDRIAKLFHMIEADVGNDADGRLTNVGRIEPSAEADFQYDSIDVLVRKMLKASSGYDFKKCQTAFIARREFFVERFTEDWI